MDSAKSFDVLLVVPDFSGRAAIGRALKAQLNARVSEHGSARSAVASYSSARFDAVICDSALENPDCWCLLRIIRSGRFGFSETPAFILASPQEHPALLGLADEFTRVLHGSSPDDAAAQVARHHLEHRRPLVLLVEDEQKAAEAAERALSKYFEVEVCGDAESALVTWRIRRHKLILLDLKLPGMSGSDLLHLVLNELPDQPILVLTAYDAPDRHQEVMLSGATEYLPKPTNLRELPGLCSRILRDHAFLQSAKQARNATQQLTQLSDRLQAANYTLLRGRTAEATLHLQRAMDVFRVSDAFRINAPGDDLWTTLMQEFEQPSSKTTD